MIYISHHYVITVAACAQNALEPLTYNAGTQSFHNDSVLSLTKQNQLGHTGILQVNGFCHLQATDMNYKTVCYTLSKQGHQLLFMNIAVFELLYIRFNVEQIQHKQHAFDQTV